MKNLKIYKRALALFTSIPILLFSGCTGGSSVTRETYESEKSDKFCLHLTVYFEDKPVTFKECEDYDIDTEVKLNGGIISYSIAKDNKKIIPFGSYTSNFNLYYVNHNNTDEIIDHPSVQKSK